MLMRSILWILIVGLFQNISAQEPISWGPDMHFSTFSIAAIDPETRESGVAVTTRVACVGNAVPWVRAGVGAVATQASTRVEYGTELLDFIESGMDAGEALSTAVAGDTMSARRQVGVISLDGTKAQHTGTGPSYWAGHREGPNYVTQGNILVGPEVLAAVAESFWTGRTFGVDVIPHLKHPMIFSLPGTIRKNENIKQPTSHLDLGSTLIDLCGGPKLPETDGESLLGLLKGKTPKSF